MVQILERDQKRPLWRGVLEFIREQAIDGGPDPTVDEIAFEFGMRRGPAIEVIKTLEREGWISRGKYNAQGDDNGESDWTAAKRQPSVPGNDRTTRSVGKPTRHRRSTL